MISTKIEWALIVAAIGCAFLWTHFHFDPVVMSLCGGIIPEDEVNISLWYFSRVSLSMSLASLCIAPIVLFVRKFRKDELGQSVNFYLGERLWYYESFLVIGHLVMSFLLSPLGDWILPIYYFFSLFFLPPIIIIPIVAIGYFCQVLAEKEFHELGSINVFAVICLTIFCASFMAFLYIVI